MSGAGMNGVGGVSFDVAPLMGEIQAFSLGTAGDAKSVAKSVAKSKGTITEHVTRLLATATGVFNKHAQRGVLRTGRDELERVIKVVGQARETVDQSLAAARADDKMKRSFMSRFRSSDAVRALEAKEKFLKENEGKLLAEKMRTQALDEGIGNMQVKLADENNYVLRAKRKNSDLLKVELGQPSISGRVFINGHQVGHWNEVLSGLQQLLGPEAKVDEVVKLGSAVVDQQMISALKEYTDKYREKTGLLTWGKAYFVPGESVMFSTNFTLKKDGALSVTRMARVYLAKEEGADPFATVDVEMELVKPHATSSEVTTQSKFFNVQFLPTVTYDDMKSAKEVFLSPKKPAAVKKAAPAGDMA